VPFGPGDVEEGSGSRECDPEGGSTVAGSCREEGAITEVGVDAVSVGRLELGSLGLGGSRRGAIL